MDLQSGTPLLVGIKGEKTSLGMIRQLKSLNPAGVLFLARNIKKPIQLSSLTQEITQRLGRKILFAIDHEGGNVVRFSGGLTAFPSAMAMGRMHDPKIAYAVGRQMGLELSALGINLNLAPVLDVASRSYNPGIGIRAWSADVKMVTKLGEWFIHGLQDHGVFACVKHFPGMGEARLDPHIHVPVIDASKKSLQKNHLPPFEAAIQARVCAVMTSHICYPGLDSQLTTFSRKIVSDLLRKKMGFTGLVISDDLSMGAIGKSCRSISEAAVQSFEAGHDLIIIASHEEKSQKEAAEALMKASQKNSALSDALHSSVLKVSALLNRKNPRGFSLQKPNLKVGTALAAKISQKTILFLRKGKIKFPLKPEERPLIVVFPKLSEIKTRFVFEGGPLNPQRFIKERLKKWGHFRLIESPIKSPPPKKILAEIKKAHRVLFFCFEAQRFGGQKKILQFINQTNPAETVVVLLRGPADLPLIDPNFTVIDPAGDRLCQINAALEVIFQ